MSRTVYVFGSNGQGFHGAGQAGWVCRGDSLNNWRTDLWFQYAMRAPVGSKDRIGKRAVFGIARGFQEGTEGCSYAIQTVTRPGRRRSVPLEDIYKQLVELWDFAKQHPEMGFQIPPIAQGYAGYTKAEMDGLWSRLQNEYGKLPNVQWVE